MPKPIGIVDQLADSNKWLQKDKKVLQLLVHDLHKLLMFSANIYGAQWLYKATSQVCRKAMKRQNDLAYNPDWKDAKNDSEWLDKLMEAHEKQDD